MGVIETTKKALMASTVDNHMEKLVENLKCDSIVKKGGRILGSTDGCVKQCKCSTAIRFMVDLLEFQKELCDWQSHWGTRQWEV